MKGEFILLVTMRRSRKFCRRGSKFDNVFLVDGGMGDRGSKYRLSGPSSARQRNAISDDGPTLNAGLVAF